TDMPEALNDPGEPVQPDIDEENATPNPPLAAPEQDMEATETAPGTVQDDKGDVSDAESVLSEVDEAQFDNFNPEDVDIVDRPAPLDDTALGQIGVHKRKRTEGEGDGAGRKKKKETRREKPKKSRKRRGAEDESGDFVEGGEVGGERRSRKRGERKSKATATVPDEDWENMDPKERRRRELDMKMDAALKSSSNRRSRKTGIDLEAAADAEVDDMRVKMTRAAQLDNEGRQTGQPAQHKLKLLPEVVALLNRNTLQNSIIDPETNLLEAVRFFLEPLSDGSLPAYNIQREIFTALAKLPVTKEALISSSIGKVVLFYTKSKRPEPGIKRMAEKLIGDWTRPILKRTDDYRKKEFQEARFD
ncbi:hypothetical protein K490DRAFT_6199, partial [Saccharata proteae CBS 121410]